MTDDEPEGEVTRVPAQYSQLRVLRRHVDLLRVSSALCPERAGRSAAAPTL